MILSQASGEKGILDARKLKIAREAQARDGGLQLVARELGFDSEEAALQAVGQALGMDMVDLTKTNTDPQVLQRFPIKLIHRHVVFPIESDGQSLVLAIGDPFDLHALDAVGAATA